MSQSKSASADHQDGLPPNAPGNLVSTFQKPRNFWAIIATLSISGLLSALEGTIVTAALPTIIHDLGGGELYVWVPNAFFLASCAVLPLFGQTSNIFGRRWLMIFAVAVFTLGSGIAGGASSMEMLIAGRAVQGVGGGGITMLMELIVCDLVPMRERGMYTGVLAVLGTLGAALGPFLGGVITERSSWRWIFYLYLPIGGVNLLCLYLFLRVSYDQTSSIRSRLRRVDLVGNGIFALAVSSVLLALTWGGTLYEWSAYRIIVPLVLGFVGLALFQFYEFSRLCKEPSVPRQLFANRTSIAALAITFLHSIISFWSTYFLPVFFQAVQGASPMQAGVKTLPTFLGVAPFGAVGGVLLTKFGRYRPLHAVGFALMIIGFGLFSILERDSIPAMWVWFQLINVAGMGILVSTQLPAVQAALPDSMAATATGVWSFMRSFGGIWGITIPAAIFNNQCNTLARDLNDSTVAAQLMNGKAFENATPIFMNSLSPSAQSEVIKLFTKAFQVVWLAGIAFGALGFLVTWIEKEIALRTELETEYGLVNDSAAVDGKVVEEQPVALSDLRKPEPVEVRDT